MHSGEQPLSRYYFYSLYIVVASGVTSGLNVLHTKYILNIDLDAAQFIVPILAGIIFGSLLARTRIEFPIKLDSHDYLIFTKLIIFSCFVTSALNIAHTEYVLQMPLKREMFIAPFIAGIFFGYLLARIKILNLRLNKLANTDSLTGVYNRHHFDKLLAVEINRVKRYGSCFSIIFIDVDNFKVINDRYGHHIGDKVLMSLARHFENNKRHSDSLARYGGEEFIILSPEIDLDGVKMFAEQLRIKIENTDFEDISSLTCSFGVAMYDSNHESSEHLLNCADNALYAAKANGKNRVVACDNGRLIDLSDTELVKEKPVEDGQQQSHREQNTKSESEHSLL